LDVSWLHRRMGADAAESFVAAANQLGNGGPGAVCTILPGLPDYRCADVRGGVCPRAKRGLDPAYSGAFSTVLLPAINVRCAFPLRKRSRARPACWLARR